MTVSDYLTKASHSQFALIGILKYERTILILGSIPAAFPKLFCMQLLQFLRLH